MRVNTVVSVTFALCLLPSSGAFLKASTELKQKQNEVVPILSREGVESPFLFSPTGELQVRLPSFAKDLGRKEQDAMTSVSWGNAASAAMVSLSETLHTIQVVDGRIRALKTQSKSIPNRRLSLESTMQSVLNDLRKGRFCRACHRTRAEFEASPDSQRETWQEHLNRVSNGTAEGAAPQVIVQKEAEYQAQLQALSYEERSLAAQLNQAKSERDTGVNDVLSTIAKWKNATQQQQQMVTAHNQQRISTIQRRLEDLEKLYNQLEGKERQLLLPTAAKTSSGRIELQSTVSQQADFYRVQKELTAGVKKNQIEELKRIQFEHEMAMSAIQERIDAGLDKIAIAERSLGMPIATSRWHGPDLKVPLGLLNVTIGRDKVALSAGLGPMTANLELKQDRLYDKDSVKVFLEAGSSAGGKSASVKAGVERETAWGSGGVRIIEKPFLVLQGLQMPPGMTAKDLLESNVTNHSSSNQYLLAPSVVEPRPSPSISVP